MRLSLRDYQDETLDRIEAAEARGVRRQAVSAATGLGKTVMFSALAERRQSRTLVLAHRDELIEQAAEKVLEVWPDCPVGVVKAERDEHHAQFVVASVQTLSRDKRMARLLEGELFAPKPFDLVIVDECHHSTADSYVKVLDGLNAGKPDGPLLVGFTATLDRGDGKGLDAIFDEVVADWPILWGIQHGWLCDLRGLRIQIDALDLSQVKVTGGDYNVGQSGRALEAADAPKAIAAAWQLYAADRRSTLVFTPTVETARQVRDAFEFVGVPFGMVSGETPLDERRDTLRRFKAGELFGVANCAVLTEGFDHPAVDCVIVARPTRSRGLYTQMIGRGTRKHPDKIDCLVLDVVGVSDRLSLVGLPSLFGVDPKEFEMNGAGIAAFLEEEAEEAARMGRITAEEAELFKTVRTSGITWVPVHEPGATAKRYVRTLKYDEPAVVITVLPDGTWGAQLRLPSQYESARGTRWKYGGAGNKTLVRGVTQETAQAVAEAWLLAQPNARVSRADAAWRGYAATDKQKDLARRLKITVKRGATAGEVSDAIDAVQIVRDERRLLAQVRA